jgi:nitroimidazol reductase NimA-like FMN-containing flavoprotein (pyridoxamine 5'-phosphate oxidase superfamily)
MSETRQGGRQAAGWPEEIEEILAGDHVVALAYPTPAKGVVILPLTNFGVRDREAGALTVNSSVGVPKKLERIRADPRVALAFHTREHALHERPEYVLVQGTAEIGEPIADYPATMLEEWERFEPWTERPRFWRWWQRIYGTRVSIVVHAERIVAWPDLSCVGEPTVLGEPLPAEAPSSQRPPGNGAVPRLDAPRAAARAGRLPHRLLGWTGADGLPMVVPVTVEGADEDGIDLGVAPGLAPPGARRAGLTAHAFGFQVLRQEQRKHTGWLQAEEEGRLRYAPHTDSSYRMPGSRLVYRTVTGAGTRLGIPAARRAGLLPRRRSGADPG